MRSKNTFQPCLESLEFRYLLSSATLIAQELNNPADLQLNGGNLYFTSNTSSDAVIQAVPQAGGTPVSIVDLPAVDDSGALRGFNAYGFDATTIYSGRGGYDSYAIDATPKAGGTSISLTDVTGGQLIGVAGNQVYYGSNFTNIDSISVDGNTISPLTSGHWVRSSAIDADAIYFVDHQTFNVDRFDLITHVVTPLITGNSSEGSIFIDSNNVYLNINGDIEEIPKSGGAVSTPVNSGTAVGYVADGTNIYYINNTSIMFVPVAGGTPLTLASIPANSLSSMAIDGTSLYWTDTSEGPTDGKIFSNPKLDAMPVETVTTTSLVSNVSSAVLGGTVTFTAAVSPLDTPTESGTVSFSSGGLTLGAASVQPDGTAVFSTAALPVGNDSVTATYAGDSSYVSSVSAPVTITITSTPPSTVTIALTKPTFPASTIAGSKFNAKLPIVLTNSGAALTGNFTINIFANTASTLDGNQRLLQALPRHFLFKAGARKTLNAIVRTLPSDLPDGDYYLLVEIVDPSGLTNQIASSALTTVAPPFIDLVVTSRSQGFPSSAVAGTKGTITVAFRNDGNVAAKGPVSFDLNLVDSNQNFTVLSESPATASVNVLPGKIKTLRFRTALPTDLPAGIYSIMGAVDINANVIDSDPPNSEFDFADTPVSVSSNDQGGMSAGTVFSDFVASSHQGAADIFDEQGSVTVPTGNTASYTFFRTGPVIEFQIIDTEIFGTSYSLFTTHFTLFHPIDTFNGKSMTLLTNKQGATGSFEITDDTSQANSLAPGTYFFHVG